MIGAVAGTEMVRDLLEFNLSLYQDWLPTRKRIKKFANIDLCLCIISNWAANQTLALRYCE